MIIVMIQLLVVITVIIQIIITNLVLLIMPIILLLLLIIIIIMIVIIMIMIILIMVVTRWDISVAPQALGGVLERAAALLPDGLHSFYVMSTLLFKHTNYVFVCFLVMIVASFVSSV